MDRSNEKEYLYYLGLDIKNLFKNKKYSQVIKLASKYLKILPNSQIIRFMRAKSYRNLCEFDKAIEDLKYNLSLEYSDHSLCELYFLYYYLNMYQEAIELLPIIYKTRCINAYSVSISELVMKIQLGIDIKVKKGDNCDYIKSQIFNYSTTMALEHIQNHIQAEEDEPLKSYFNKNINLDYLFKTVRISIDNSKKLNKDDILEVHNFAIFNIGYQGNDICNSIKVVVVPNTNKIITMYPICDVDYNNITEINIDYDKLFKREPNKVKKISQIDKFNAKYNRWYK